MVSGHFRSSVECRALPPAPVRRSCPCIEKEEEPGFFLRAGGGKKRDFPHCVSLGATGAAAGELRSVSKQIKTLFRKRMKEFGRRRKA